MFADERILGGPDGDPGGFDAFLPEGLAEEPAPFAPPPATDGQERLARLRLIRSRRVGPATYHRLLAAHGSGRAALAALPEVAKAAGVARYTPCPEGVAQAEIRAGRRIGARLLLFGDPDYPPRLAAIPGAPIALWALGDLSLGLRPAVAVVGSRNASSLGLRAARRLARELGEAGVVVVSGMARGIDTAAHECALATGTIAVHAGGVDHIYPPENSSLAAEIGRTGLRLSEHPPGHTPQARHFAQRNRLVAGLADAVLVVEARAQSGSLITASIALDLGKEVLAVPASPLDPRSEGCNRLIRDGATLVRHAGDVLEVLGSTRLPPRVPRPDAPEAAGEHRSMPPGAAAQGSGGPEGTPGTQKPDLAARLLSLLGAGGADLDQLSRDAGRPMAEVAATVSRLEIEGRVRRDAGGRLIRLD